MQACIVHRCTRPALSGLCVHHGGPEATRPTVRPLSALQTALADLLDPARMTDDIAAHNARLTAHPLPIRR